MSISIVDENQTLEKWIKSGGNMISHIAEWGCCASLGINGRILRSMKLSDIFAVETHGELAKREINSFNSRREV